MARCILALLLLALVTGTADARHVCFSEARVVRDIASKWPSAVIERIEGDEAQSVTDAYNALPPRSDHLADVVLIFTVADLPVQFVAFFREGCMVVFDELGPELVAKIRPGA